MIAKILIAIAVVLAVLAVVIAMRPDEFRVSRSASVAVPPAKVFTQVNDLRKWEGWSPWAKIDPGMKKNYQGPEAGAGAGYSWAGNSQVGEGNMTITESRPDELVRMRLEFLKPFKGTNDVEFTFKPEGNRTVVTWAMSGRNNFMSKAMGLFMNCEKMVGGQFEQGLSQMKAAAEKS